MAVAWAIVINRNRALIFERSAHDAKWTRREEMNHPEGREKEQELVSDRAGQTSQTGRCGHSALTSEVSAKDKEVGHFIKKVAERINNAAEEGLFEKILLVADGRLMRLLRNNLEKAALAKIAQVVPKNLSRLEDAEISERLATYSG